MWKAVLSLAAAPVMSFTVEAAASPSGDDATPKAKEAIYAMADNAGEPAQPGAKPQRPNAFELTPGGTPYAAELNIHMVDALLIERSDLLGLKLMLNILSVKDSEKSSLEFSLLENTIQYGEKPAIAPSPFLSIPAKSLAKGWSSVDLKDAYQAWDKSRKGSFGFAISLKGGSPSAKVSIAPISFDFDFKKTASKFELDYRSRPNEQLFDQGIVPTEGVYAQVVDGKITYGGKRLKLWGVCRHDSENAFTADRVRKLGFNAIRIWGPRTGGWYSDDASAKRYEISKSESVDCFDKFFAECKKDGLFIMLPSLHYLKFPEAIFDDASFLRKVGEGDKDWDAWKKAMAEGRKESINNAWLKYFDERVRECYERNAKNVLAHVNPYTGKPYSQDEAICIYEIDNENGFLQWMLVSDRIAKLPAYFKAKLQSRWSLWLKKRYGSDKAIKDAWGVCADGESLEKSSYSLAPTLKAASKFPKARGEDFIRFMSGLVLDYNKDLTALIKSSAPKGVGANVAPIIADTQFQKNIPWLYANAAGNDTVSFGIYPFTLSSTLTNPPSLYVMDHLTVKDKATVIYEYNVGRPNPYRTESVYKAALLGAWQDWDGIFFHYFSELRGHGRKDGDEAMTSDEFLVSRQLTPTPWDKASNIAGDNSFSDGVDMAKHSASAIAGRLFRSMEVKPAASPAIFSVGSAGFNSFDFARGIPELTAAPVFQQGARIVFDPKQKEPLKIIGAQEKAQAGPVSWNGGEVVWDRDNGRVVVDAPSVKAYIGKPAPYKFKDGIALSGVDAPFIAFGMLTEDGSPLLEAKPGTKILLSSVYDSQNLGFDIDLSNVAEGGPFVHPLEMGKRTKSIGLPPSMLKPVKFLLSFPKAFNGELFNFDYAMRRTAAFDLKSSNEIAFPEGYASYISELRVSSWGAPAAPRMIEAPAKAAQVQSAARKQTPKTDLWCPVPLIDWNTSYEWAHQAIRDGSVNFASISKFDGDAKKAKSIAVTEMELMKGATANVSLSFEDGELVRIDLEFVNPPPFSELVALCKRSIAQQPKKEEIVNTAAITSSVEWEFNDPKSGRCFTATAKELQGVSSASFSLR